MLVYHTSDQNLSYEMPNNQICFITQRAIDRCLRFIVAEEIIRLHKSMPATD